MSHLAYRRPTNSLILLTAKDLTHSSWWVSAHSHASGSSSWLNKHTITLAYYNKYAFGFSVALWRMASMRGFLCFAVLNALARRLRFVLKWMHMVHTPNPLCLQSSGEIVVLLWSISGNAKAISYNGGTRWPLRRITGGCPVCPRQTALWSSKNVCTTQLINSFRNEEVDLQAIEGACQPSEVWCQ